MLKQAVGVAGLVCLAFGWVLALLLAWAKVDASAADVFAGIVDGLSPSQSLYALDCPYILAQQETGLVRATVLNPTDTPLNYRIQIEAPDFTVTGLPSVLTETIPAGTAVTFTWLIQPKRTGGVGIKVKALSEEDLSRHPPPSPPSWSTSYSQGCGVGVSQLGGLTVLQATVIGGSSLLSGLVLTTWWVYTRWAEWRKRNA